MLGLCTSGFVDDVMFSQNGLYTARGVGNIDYRFDAAASSHKFTTYSPGRRRARCLTLLSWADSKLRNGAKSAVYDCLVMKVITISCTHVICCSYRNED